VQVHRRARPIGRDRCRSGFATPSMRRGLGDPGAALTSTIPAAPADHDVLPKQYGQHPVEGGASNQPGSN
jgi:hypothetical protein